DAMKKLFAVACLVATIFICGCGGENSAKQPPPKPTITVADAQTKLAELSTGLDVRGDDMKEVTFYRCPIDSDSRPPIWIIPYVVADKNFNAALRQDILYVGRETLYFDKLYIKTSSGVETFQYPKTVKSVNRGYVGEEYDGLMSNELYRKLQTAVSEGGAKFRFEGRSFAERELTPKEIANMDKVFKIYELLNSVDVEK
ncbi:MAG: hypothetical protein IKN27_10605, partial [Selenomonadaceae bacterium]|nr:hypothetical protein [Selenomonadaceae bacterium]